MPQPAPDWRFPQRLALTTAVVVGLLLLWQLSHVVVLAFAAIVLATMLRGIGKRLQRWFGLAERSAVVTGALLLLAVLALVFWGVGEAIGEQAGTLREQLPKAWEALARWLSGHAAGRQLLGVVGSALGSDSSGQWLARAGTMALGAMGSALLIVIASVYLAADADAYRRAFVRLVPPAYRGRAREALHDSGHALARWLLGQGASMLFLGATTTVGLWLLGVPLALVLGAITGLLAFVPFFGAMVAGVLAVLMAFVEGPQQALYVGLLFFALQQVEEYLLLPFVQRWAVSLPPVLTLFAALIFGILLGPLGVLFATPMMVMAMVLTRKLYVEDTLGDAPRGGDDERRAA